MKKIAVVGASESVGREILSFLEADGYKASDVFALEHKAVLGNQVSYGEDDELDVLNLDDFDFSKVNVAIFATTAELAKRYVPKALSKGVKVVDCSTAFFADSDVPMIVAGVNDDKIAGAGRGLVSVPSAAVTQMLLPLSRVCKNTVSRVWSFQRTCQPPFTGKKLWMSFLIRFAKSI